MAATLKEKPTDLKAGQTAFNAEVRISVRLLLHSDSSQGCSTVAAASGEGSANGHLWKGVPRYSDSFVIGLASQR